MLRKMVRQEFFFNIDAQSRITCTYAPWAYGLPYNYSKCKLEINDNNFNWESKRSIKGFELKGSCVSVGEEMQAKSGSLEEFLLKDIHYMLIIKIPQKWHIPYMSLGNLRKQKQN